MCGDCNNLLSDPRFLYLDGISCRFSRALKEIGILSDQCVPINYDKEIVDNLLEHTKNAQHGYFKDVIVKLGTEYLKRVGLVWYDGNGTVLGDDKISLIEDIEVLLDHMSCDFKLVVSITGRANQRKTLYVQKLIKGTPTTKLDHAKWKAAKKKYKKTNPFAHVARGRGINQEKQVMMLENMITNKGFTYSEKRTLRYSKMLVCIYYLMKNNTK